MKRIYLSLSAAAIAALLLVPATINAQEEKDKSKDKKEKVEKVEKKEGQQIIITTKKDVNEKIVVEINGDKVTVNGKPIEDIKDGDMSVNVRRLKNGTALYSTTHPTYNFNWDDNKAFSYNFNDNTAMLGVVTDKTDGGVKIIEVNNETAASKIGLKEDDVITKVDGKTIADPDDLTKVIRSHKPGDKVVITYQRDKKEQTATAELGKYNGPFMGNLGKFSPNMDFKVMPRIEQNIPRTFNSQNGYSLLMDNNRPKLGLSVQDTDDGKGVKVLEVDEESNAAKAGVKKDDVILSINDKVVNTADEVAKIVKENREKPSMKLKVNRGGKTQEIEVKMPRKLVTKDI
jgi:serine protease Do